MIQRIAWGALLLLLVLCTMSSGSPVARFLSRVGPVVGHHIVPRSSLYEAYDEDEDQAALDTFGDTDIPPQQLDLSRFEQLYKRSGVQQVNSPQAKRALSLFAHWRAPYASGEEPAYDLSTRGEGRPVGRPLRWG